MPTTLLALQVLMILLPGFAAAYIVQMFAVRGAQTDFDKVIEASLYSVLIYGIFSLITRGELPFDLIAPAGPSAEPSIHWHPLRLLGLFGLMILVSIAAVVYINKDGNALLRKFGVTTRTTRRSVWNDIFEGETKTDQVVQIELEGNRSLIGVLSYWSDSADDGSIYVEQAKWVPQTGEPIPVSGPGVLLTKEAKIKSISLLDDLQPGDRTESSDLPNSQ